MWNVVVFLDWFTSWWLWVQHRTASACEYEISGFNSFLFLFWFYLCSQSVSSNGAPLKFCHKLFSCCFSTFLFVHWEGLCKQYIVVCFVLGGAFLKRDGGGCKGLGNMRWVGGRGVGGGGRPRLTLYSYDLCSSVAVLFCFKSAWANKHLCVQYIEPVFSLLFNLLKEVRECDTKVRLDQVKAGQGKAGPGEGWTRWRLDQVPGGGAVPVLVSCPRYLFSKLKVQNNAGRLISRTSRSTHVTAMLHSLHWLPIEQRV